VGKPVRILDLAEDMIRLSGLTPYEDVDIVFSGIRSGEKLFEELEMSGESLLKTLHPKIYIGKIAKYSGDQIDQILNELRLAVTQNSDELVRRTYNGFLADAKVELPSTTEQKAIPAEASFITKPTKLGLAEK